MVDPISGRAVRVVKGRRLYIDPFGEAKAVASLEIFEPQAGLHSFKWDWEHGIVHLRRQHILHPALVLQVACHDVNRAFRVIGRHKKRKAVDVVPMCMSQQ